MDNLDLFSEDLGFLLDHDEVKNKRSEEFCTTTRKLILVLTTVLTTADSCLRSVSRSHSKGAHEADPTDFTRRCQTTNKQKSSSNLWTQSWNKQVEKCCVGACVCSVTVTRTRTRHSARGEKTGRKSARAGKLNEFCMKLPLISTLETLAEIY